MSIGRTCGKARRRGEHSHAARSGRRGNQWQSVVVINCRTSVVISGNQWSSVVVINCRTSVVRRPSWRTPRTPMRRSVSHLMREAIRAHQTSSKVIRGHHQRHSEVISRNQSSSGRLAYASRLKADLTSIFSKTRPPRDATAASEHSASTA